MTKPGGTYHHKRLSNMENIEHGVNPPNVATLNNKEVFNDLNAVVLSYYVRNVKTLSKDEMEDYKRFDKAKTPQQLKTWAENIHITGSMGDMTIIELANVIKNMDDKTLDDLMRQASQNPRIINEKSQALTQQIQEVKTLEKPDTIVLFRNGTDNFTAIGEDAKKTANTLGVMPDNKLNELDVTNINRAGAYLLFQNSMPYKVVDPVTDISAVNGNNDIATANKLMMQMGNIAVLSKGNTVRFETNQQIFGDESTLEIKKGLFYVTKAENDKLTLKATPIQQFDTHDGKSTSYLYDMSASELKNLQTFFNDNFDALKKTTSEYATTRKTLDDNLNTLIGQNDRLATENPETIILIKQRGFIEAFSDSAINAANTLGLQLYNRTNHKGDVTVPFTKMSVDDYKKLIETDNNVYLALPKANDRLTDANLTRVNAAKALHTDKLMTNKHDQKNDQKVSSSFKR